MKRDWHMRRELLATPDGQRRWDRAYRALLTWTCADDAAPALVVSKRVSEEWDDAGGDRCTGVDAAAGASADD
jgi:hypothetical protein